MKSFIALAFTFVISWHGTDYQSILDLLNSLPRVEAEKAQVFPCLDEQNNWGFCVKYWQE